MLQITSDPADIDKHLPLFRIASQLEHLWASTEESERVGISACAGCVDGQCVDSVGIASRLGGEGDEFVLAAYDMLSAEYRQSW